MIGHFTMNFRVTKGMRLGLKGREVVPVLMISAAFVMLVLGIVFI